MLTSVIWKVWLPDPRRRLFAHALILSLGLLPLFAQSATQPQPYEYFSGEVVELTADQLTVERKVRGKEQQRHTFLLRAETKVEGKLALRARVTVGFKTSADGDVAVRVIVRPRPSPPAPTKGF